ncbi:hypothetical protein RRG08_052079 [Elysia crispata]|uniref:Uncharacterized protein n=1 Tax=Elysia crispata TaxID=231223 RepID=A0AAE1A429_9GAST|nr:hypothetical protein RRG08_052079 [Elysia crispata]
MPLKMSWSDSPDLLYLRMIVLSVLRNGVSDKSHVCRYSQLSVTGALGSDPNTISWSPRTDAISSGFLPLSPGARPPQAGSGNGLEKLHHA